MKRRVEFTLGERTLRLLDIVAQEHDFRLMPHHAARAGREWDWAEALRYALDDYLALAAAREETLENAAFFIDDLLSRHGASCRYEGGELVVEMGGEVYRRKLLGG